MIPDYYEFLNTVKIISGNKALENIPHELGQMGASNPMVITDKGVVGAGLVKVLLDAFGGATTAIGALFDDTPIDSSDKVISEIAALYRKNGCDSIIAIGGGSVIDTAKGVNILVTEDSDDLLKFMGSDRLSKPMKPFIVIPTTAGTGSEVSTAAVILNVTKGKKMQFVSPLLLPRLAVLDPRMTMTMPAKITVATALDALTHAVEAFIGPQKNPLSDAFAAAAITLIRENVFQAVKRAKDEQVRLAMANAALLAGVAFSNSMVGVVHAAAHALGGVCHLPHGVANGIMLPFGMEFNMDVVGEHVAALLLPLAGEGEYIKTPETQRATESVAAVRRMTSELGRLTGIPVRLQEAGVAEEILPQVAEATINDGAIAYNPKPVTLADALGLLKAAY